MRTDKPPKLALRFFRWYCRPKMLDYIEGDLMEVYERRLKESGKRVADLKFIVDVLLLLRPAIIRPAEGYQSINQYGMFKNYLKVGVRNILKYKVFSFINVFGLAVAMSVCMLIILMLADQHRYDQFHEKKDRIYRILSDYEDSRQPYATSPYPLAAALKSEYPIIENAVNLTPAVGGDAVHGQNIVDMRGYFTDPSFFNVFSFELVQGDKTSALEKSNSMVISIEMARQLFEEENPIGKTIEFSDRQLAFPQEHDGVGVPPVAWGSFTVTGVIDETKFKSHLKFDVLVSASSMQTLYAEKKLDDKTNNWEWYFRTYTYVLLSNGKNDSDLSNALHDLVTRKYSTIKSEQTKGFHLIGQKLTDVQLGLAGNDTNNRLPLIGYYFLAILALVIMITACLNYTNLAVARALTRAKEIAIRKVTGAHKKSLVFQFLSESIITSLLALAMAILLLVLIKPAFMHLWVNKFLEFELPSSPSVYIIFLGFALLIGVVAGLYPAFYLSTFQPIRALKHLQNIKPGKLGMRRILSVSQFVISLFFITTSILIFNQFKHYMNFDYGFVYENIINVELQGVDYQKLSNEFSALPEVAAISATDIIPSTGRSNGSAVRKMNTNDEFTDAWIIMTDEKFAKNLGLKLMAGNPLPVNGQSSDRLILVNEDFVRRMGYKHPADIIGETVETKWNKEVLEVTGVVQNFRYKLLLNDDHIGPLIMRNQPNQFQYLNVKISSSDLMGTVARLEQKWKKIDSAHPFKYEFFDDQLATTHKGIFDLVYVIGFIAFLAITISCLGLLGMTTYTAERKRKEVGIRKVLGAEDKSIALLLSRSFFSVLLMAILIGAPFSYFVNNLWLQTLPNRVEFGLGTVLIGTLLLLALGVVTIGSQTLRAAKTNPVDALKME
jgi:putative ABC transport system permease protein